MKTRNTLLVTSLFLWCVHASGQNILFSTRHDGGSDDGINCVRTTTDGSFIVFGSRQGEEGSKAQVCISLLDHEGNYYNTVNYGDSSRDHRLGYDPGAKTMDDQFSLGVTVGYSASLWLLNSLADTLWCRSPFVAIGDTSQADGTAIADNGDILLLGTVKHIDTPRKMFLARYSNTGSFKWAQEYAPSNSWPHYAFAMDTLNDGGFILSGYRVDPYSWDSDGWLVRTDSMGTLVWDSYLNTGGDDGMRPLVSLPGGGFMVGGMEQRENPNQPGDYCCSAPYFARYADDGTVLWDSTYAGGGNEVYSFDMSLSTEGNILSSGTAWSQYGQRAYLFSIGIDGDSLWHHQYFAPDGSCINYSYWPYSVIQESATSIVVAGFVGLCGNDQWVMRVDAQGTPPPNMQLWTDVAEGVGPEPGITVSPNPTDGTITLRSPALLGHVEVFDLSGRRVLDVPIGTGMSNIPIDLGGLRCGTYIVAATDREGRTWHQVVIKK